MAVTRFVVDVLTEEPLSSRKSRIAGKEASDAIRAVVMKEMDDVAVIETNAPFFHVHHHQSTQELMCPVCVDLARDQRA